MYNNVISRIFNNYVQVVNEQVLLPKAVMIVIEEDLLRASDHYKKGTSTYLKPCLDWLANALFSATDQYKKQLPTKSRKFKYPQFFWVPAIFHNALGTSNVYRDKFNTCLNEVVQKTRGMKILELPTWKT